MNELDIWTKASAIATIVSAFAAAITAAFAGYAATTWLRGLQLQRRDDCISAIHGLSSVVGRVVSCKKNKSEDLWKAYDEAWAAWTKFKQSFAVAHLYQKLPCDCIVEMGNKRLEELGSFCRIDETQHEADEMKHKGDEINNKFGDLKNAVERAFENKHQIFIK